MKTSDKAKTAKRTRKQEPSYYVGHGKGLGRLSWEELGALMRELQKKAKTMKYRRGPNGIEIRPEDTASGKGLISFRVLPVESKKRRK